LYAVAYTIYYTDYRVKYCGNPRSSLFAQLMVVQLDAAPPNENDEDAPLLATQHDRYIPPCIE